MGSVGLPEFVVPVVVSQREGQHDGCDADGGMPYIFPGEEPSPETGAHGLIGERLIGR